MFCGRVCGQTALPGWKRPFSPCEGGEVPVVAQGQGSWGWGWLLCWKDSHHHPAQSREGQLVLPAPRTHLVGAQAVGLCPL